MQQIIRFIHTNLFSKRNLNELFEKIKPDKYVKPQLTLSLARR